jgi:microcystin-dependent protein
MADAFIGEIRMFPFDYAPIGWLACDGQRVNISSQQPLYTLLGSRFGGDGRTYFNVPNLNGRIPVDAGVSPATGQNYAFAQAVGEETVTLTAAQAPSHTHSFSTRVSSASTTGMTGVATATNNVGASMLSRAATSEGKLIFAYDVPPTSQQVNLGAQVSPAYGTAQSTVEPHPNMQPYLVMGYYICTDGTYPFNPN